MIAEAFGVLCEIAGALQSVTDGPALNNRR